MKRNEIKRIFSCIALSLFLLSSLWSNLEPSVTITMRSYKSCMEIFNEILDYAEPGSSQFFPLLFSLAIGAKMSNMNQYIGAKLDEPITIRLFQNQKGEFFVVVYLPIKNLNNFKNGFIKTGRLLKNCKIEESGGHALISLKKSKGDYLNWATKKTELQENEILKIEFNDIFLEKLKSDSKELEKIKFGLMLSEIHGSLKKHFAPINFVNLLEMSVSRAQSKKNLNFNLVSRVVNLKEEKTPAHKLNISIEISKELFGNSLTKVVQELKANGLKF